MVIDTYTLVMSILVQQEVHVTLSYGHFTEAMFDGDMMEQKELVPMEQGKEEGDDQLTHLELTKEPHPGT